MAYNVRKNKTLDYDPATGEARTHHLFGEVAVALFGVTMIILLTLLARRVLL